ncbi:MAG: hypothetical protein HYT22_00695 [Candidatus Niyogibacteria bacterium]|nr:hypothetical protein [Candidatus Niyogibacteria bacterium]
MHQRLLRQLGSVKFCELIEKAAPQLIAIRLLGILGMIAILLFAGCAPQQPSQPPQNPPVNVEVNVSVNGEPWPQENRPYRPENAHEPIVLYDELAKFFERPSVASEPPAAKKRVVSAAQTLGLGGKTVVFDYNSRGCLRSDWPDYRAEEAVKMTVARGFDYHGARISLDPKADLIAIVCLSNVRNGSIELPNNKGYVDEYVARVNVELIGSGRLVATGTGEQRYYRGSRACWYQDRYIAKGGSCIDNADTAFRQAAYRAMYHNMRSMGGVPRAGAPASGVGAH